MVSFHGLEGFGFRVWVAIKGDVSYSPYFSENYWTEGSSV